MDTFIGLFDLEHIRHGCLIQIIYDDVCDCNKVLNQIEHFIRHCLKFDNIMFYDCIVTFNQYACVDLSFSCLDYFRIENIVQEIDLINFKENYKYGRMNGSIVIVSIEARHVQIFDSVCGDIVDYTFSPDHIVKSHKENLQYKFICEQTYPNFMETNKNNFIHMHDLIKLIEHDNSKYHQANGYLHTNLKNKLDKYILIMVCMNRDHILLKELNHMILCLLSEIIFL